LGRSGPCTLEDNFYETRKVTEMSVHNNVREMVTGFTKQCMARGVTNPDTIARLLESEIDTMQVKAAAQQAASDPEVVTGFCKRCAEYGITDPRVVETLLKQAVKDMAKHGPRAVKAFKNYEAKANSTVTKGRRHVGKS
jgi:hypothetical protein